MCGLVLLLAHTIEPGSAWIIGALAAVLAAAMVRPAVRSTTDTVRHAWPAALPVSSVARSLAARVPSVVGATVLSATLAGAAATAWPVPIVLSGIVGVAVGTGLAAAWPVPFGSTGYPDSRYRRKTRAQTASASLTPVVSDLHALVAARMQPRVLARTVAPILIALPVGLAAHEVLLALAALMAVVYATFLLAALRPFVDGTRQWLASVPVGPEMLVGRVQRSVRVRLALVTLGLAPIALAALGPLRGALGLAALALTMDRIVAHRLGRIGTGR